MEASITLPKDQCRTFVGSYTPSEVLDGMDNPTTDPGAVVFTDMATANSDDIFGDPVMSQNDTATCPLCP